MGSFIGNPPLPTDQGPDPAPDVPPVNAYSPASVAQDTLNFVSGNADAVKSVIDYVFSTDDPVIRFLLFIAKIIGEIWIDILKILVPLQVDYNNAVAELHKQELPIGVPAARDMVADELQILMSALGSTATNQYAIPGSDITAQGEDLFNNFILPFALWSNTADPTQFGAGFQNAQFLLRRAMILSLAEYTLDSMKNLVGFGWVSHLQPLIGFVDRAINPSNIVRQSMEQAYSYLMKAPMQRDLNHLYPIKDLGVSALAKLYIRGAIDEQTYLDKCLDAGLNNTQAQQLILETAKLLSTSQIGTLLNHGFITEDDAFQQLKEQGYPDWQARALLYLETHDRFFSIQERVGNEAVTAWKKGIIAQDQLESLLQNLGFTQDEIALLEIEGQFTKQSTDRKDLTYSQVRSLFEQDLVDLDYVINFLQNEGYSSDNVRLLILLDFVKKEERALRDAEITARIRVQAAQAREQAAVAANRNETELAQAKQALAAELDDVQKQLGLLQSLPSILDLIGISL